MPVVGRYRVALDARVVGRRVQVQRLDLLELWRAVLVPLVADLLFCCAEWLLCDGRGGDLLRLDLGRVSEVFLLGLGSARFRRRMMKLWNVIDKARATTLGPALRPREVCVASR